MAAMRRWDPFRAPVGIQNETNRLFGRIALPQQCDPEKVQASMDNGVLTVEVPKAEQAKPRRIQVKATS